MNDNADKKEARKYSANQNINYKQVENKPQLSSITYNAIALITVLSACLLPFLTLFINIFSGNLKQQENQKNFLNILVVDNAGKPVDGAELLFISNNVPNTKNTDNQGYIQLIFPPEEEFDILIKKEGFKPIVIKLNTKNNSTINRIYQLQNINKLNTEDMNKPNKK